MVHNQIFTEALVSYLVESTSKLLQKNILPSVVYNEEVAKDIVCQAILELLHKQPESFKGILNRFKSGEISKEEAQKEIKALLMTIIQKDVLDYYRWEKRRLSRDREYVDRKEKHSEFNSFEEQTEVLESKLVKQVGLSHNDARLLIDVVCRDRLCYDVYKKYGFDTEAECLKRLKSIRREVKRVLKPHKVYGKQKEKYG